MNLRHTPAALCLAVAWLAAGPALADAGHDHGDTASAATGAALPRFSAVSETFELVGVLDGQQLTLYLDRYADNGPVKDAQLQLEIGGVKVAVEPHADGEYQTTLAETPKPGVLPVIATVIAGPETDLLAGELDIHEEAHVEEAAHEPGWQAFAVWAAGGLIALFALVWISRRVMAARSLRAGGAA